MPLVAKQVVVSGRVQGVGFRDAMIRAARATGVTGWVRNRRDGTVEAWLQGTPSAVDSMVLWCKQGPPAARVGAVDVTLQPVDEARHGFDLRAGA